MLQNDPNDVRLNSDYDQYDGIDDDEYNDDDDYNYNYYYDDEDEVFGSGSGGNTPVAHKPFSVE